MPQGIGRERVVVWAEYFLWTAGAAALFVGGYHWNESASAQRHGAEELRELTASYAALHEGSLVGRVAITRLGLDAVIFEGTTERTLDLGVGHLTGSALPVKSGNVVLAAHRDTFFRPLRNIRIGDSIIVDTPQGRADYRVESTEVVKPTELSVIEPTSEATLTLITCYPFTFLGAAPERFIVHAGKTGQRPVPPLLRR